MNAAILIFRVNDSLKNQFTQAARSHDRSGAQLLRDFMRDFVQQPQTTTRYDAWFRHQVQIGLDEVEDQFTARRAATRCRLGADD